MDQYMMIGLTAERVNELEAVRIADENRVRSITQAADAREATLDHIVAVKDGIADLETKAIKQLERELKNLPATYQWVSETPGLGAKTVGRLIGALGNPAWNFMHDRQRRGPAELWAYMGLHVVEGQAPRRRRGERANWSTEAKTRAFLCAEGCVKAVGGETKSGAVRKRSPYRDVYDAAREKHAEAVHTTDCVRCGPSGKPAQPGSPLADGHKHARAMREVMKAITRDLFLASRDDNERFERAMYARDDRS